MQLSSTMGTWKTKIIQKKSRGSRQTGKSKGIVASPLAKYMCRRGRSYKHPLYQEIMAGLGIKKSAKK